MVKHDAAWGSTLAEYNDVISH